jgi:hypothetical protein
MARFSMASLTSLPYLKVLPTYSEISLVVFTKTPDCLASEQSYTCPFRSLFPFKLGLLHCDPWFWDGLLRITSEVSLGYAWFLFNRAASCGALTAVVVNSHWNAICDFPRRRDKLMTELMNQKRSTS